MDRMDTMEKPLQKSNWKGTAAISRKTIDAYKTLAEHRPEQETRFRERIKQLQELARQRGEGGGKNP